ncbi:unnamed protein product, partial [marine sediment metagenome]
IHVQRLTQNYLRIAIVQRFDFSQNSNVASLLIQDFSVFF